MEDNLYETAFAIYLKRLPQGSVAVARKAFEGEAQNAIEAALIFMEQLNKKKEEENEPT